MKIHEYQGKELFKKFGVTVLENQLARTPEEAAAAYDKLGGKIAVVKSQIHAGGRGKGTFKENADQHGVQLVKSAEEAAAAAKNMLGNHLVTIQTGPEGKKVNQVLVEAGCDIDRELYLGIVLDRADKKPVLMPKVSRATKSAIFAKNWASKASPSASLTNSCEHCASCTSKPTAA